MGFTSNISRRKFLGALGVGAGLAVLPGLSIFRRNLDVAPVVADPNSIDFPDRFFGDDPHRAHSFLWNKQKFENEIKNLDRSHCREVSVVVVGGGISGLASAYLLRNEEPMLLEQAHHFGGNSRGEEWHGISYSLAAAYIANPTAGTPIGDFMNELGAIEIGRVKGEGDLVKLDSKLVDEFWDGATDPLRKPEFIKLKNYFLDVMNSRNGRQYPDIPIVDENKRAEVEELDAISFRVHLEKVNGGPLHPHILSAIEAYCWSALGAGSEGVSAAAGLNFYASEFGEIMVPPGGNSAIAQKIYAKLAKTLPAANLVSDAIVLDVRVESDGVLVTYADKDKKIKFIKCKYAIMACPKFVVKHLLSGIEPERLAAIQDLTYIPYLVANVFVENFTLGDKFYDLFDLHSSGPKYGAATDVVLATYAKQSPRDTVLTLYHPMLDPSLRMELLTSPTAFSRYKAEFETYVYKDLAPLLAIPQQKIRGMRIVRWGHALPIPKPGLMLKKTYDRIRKPFQDRVFFVQQDNWALPAFETAVTEALHWAPLVAKNLQNS